MAHQEKPPQPNPEKKPASREESPSAPAAEKKRTVPHRAAEAERVAAAVARCAEIAEARKRAEDFFRELQDKKEQEEFRDFLWGVALPEKKKWDEAAFSKIEAVAQKSAAAGKKKPHEFEEELKEILPSDEALEQCQHALADFEEELQRTYNSMQSTLLKELLEEIGEQQSPSIPDEGKKKRGGGAPQRGVVAQQILQRAQEGLRPFEKGGSASVSERNKFWKAAVHAAHAARLVAQAKPARASSPPLTGAEREKRLRALLKEKRSEGAVAGAQRAVSEERSAPAVPRAGEETQPHASAKVAPELAEAEEGKPAASPKLSKVAEEGGARAVSRADEEAAEGTPAPPAGRRRFRVRRTRTEEDLHGGEGGGIADEEGRTAGRGTVAASERVKGEPMRPEKGALAKWARQVDGNLNDALRLLKEERAPERRIASLAWACYNEALRGWYPELGTENKEKTPRGQKGEVPAFALADEIKDAAASLREEKDRLAREIIADTKTVNDGHAAEEEKEKACTRLAQRFAALRDIAAQAEVLRERVEALVGLKRVFGEILGAERVQSSEKEEILEKVQRGEQDHIEKPLAARMFLLRGLARRVGAPELARALEERVQAMEERFKGEVAARLQENGSQKGEDISTWLKERAKVWEGEVAALEREIINAVRAHGAAPAEQKTAPPAMPPEKEKPKPAQASEEAPPERRKEAAGALRPLRLQALDDAIAACGEEKARKHAFVALAAVLNEELDGARTQIRARYGSLKEFDRRHGGAWATARKAVAEAVQRAEALQKARKRNTAEREILVERANVAKEKLTHLYHVLGAAAPAENGKESSAPEAPAPETPLPEARGEATLDVSKARKALEEVRNWRQKIEARLAQSGVSVAEVRGMFISFLRARDALQHALNKFIHLSEQRALATSPEEEKEHAAEVAAARRNVAAATREFSEALRPLLQECEERTLLRDAPRRAKALADKIRKLRAALEGEERHKPKAIAALSAEDYEEQWEAYEASESGRRAANLEKDLRKAQEEYAALVRSLTALKERYEEEARRDEQNAAAGNANPYYTPNLFADEAREKVARIEALLAHVRAAMEEPRHSGEQEATARGAGFAPPQPQAAAATQKAAEAVRRGDADSGAVPAAEAAERAREAPEKEAASAHPEAAPYAKPAPAEAEDLLRVSEGLVQELQLRAQDLAGKEEVRRFLAAVGALAQAVQEFREARNTGSGHDARSNMRYLAQLEEKRQRIAQCNAALRPLIAAVQRVLGGHTEGGGHSQEEPKSGDTSRTAPYAEGASAHLESGARDPEEAARAAQRDFFAFMAEMQKEGKDPAQHFLYGPLKKEMAHLERVLGRFARFKEGKLKDEDGTPTERRAAAFQKELAWRAENVRTWMKELRAQLTGAEGHAAGAAPAEAPARGAEAANERESPPRATAAPLSAEAVRTSEEKEQHEIYAEREHLAEVLQRHAEDPAHDFLAALHPARPRPVGVREAKPAPAAETFDSQRAIILATIDSLNHHLREVERNAERLDNPRGVAKIWQWLQGTERVARKKLQLKQERDRLMRQIRQFSEEADRMLLYHHAARLMQRAVARTGEGQWEEALRPLMPRKDETLRQWIARLQEAVPRQNQQGKA